MKNLKRRNVMGGRGSPSGISSASPSPQQRRLMNNLVKRNAKEAARGFSNPKFTKNKDGSITYEYQIKHRTVKIHGGKMQSPEKNDIYERTEHYSGKIMRDGLRKKNKTVYTDVLVKRGK